MQMIRAVRAIVRPDKRGEYLERWVRFTEAAEAVGVRVRLCEDLFLPGRFLEFIEYQASEEMRSNLEDAYTLAELRVCCVRREGDDLTYRELERHE